MGITPRRCRQHVLPKRRHYLQNNTSHIPQDNYTHVQCSTDLRSQKSKPLIRQYKYNVDNDGVASTSFPHIHGKYTPLTYYKTAHCTRMWPWCHRTYIRLTAREIITSNNVVTSSPITVLVTPAFCLSLLNQAQDIPHLLHCPLFRHTNHT